jgi:hypothetical protein
MMYDDAKAQNQQPALMAAVMEAEPSESNHQREYESVTKQSAAEGAKDQTSYRLIN